jgi:hypothetical protein
MFENVLASARETRTRDGAAICFALAVAMVEIGLASAIATGAVGALTLDPSTDSVRIELRIGLPAP